VLPKKCDDGLLVGAGRRRPERGLQGDLLLPLDGYSPVHPVGLSLHTLRNWEHGKRRPDPAARAYLKVIEKDPGYVSDVLAK
jgi:hypothetical protein